MRQGRNLKVAGVLLLAVFLYALSDKIAAAATWTDINPCGMPSTSTLCQVGSAINTSSSLQKKAGDLTLNDTLTLTNPYTHTCDADRTVSCSVDADCRNAGAGFSCIAPSMLLVTGTPGTLGTFTWTSHDPGSPQQTLTTWGGNLPSTSYVDLWNSNDGHLPPSPLRKGYVAVENNATTFDNTAAINAVAADPSIIRSSYAIQAFDNTSSSTSYALRAKAGYSSIMSTALRAIAPYDKALNRGAQNAWAAYFEGNVMIESGEKKFSVVMGGAGALDSNIAGALCLGGYEEMVDTDGDGVDELMAYPRACLSEWPEVTASEKFWNDTGEYLQAESAMMNVAFGGSTENPLHPDIRDPNTVFFLTARPGSEADILVRGTGRSTTLTIE